MENESGHPQYGMANQGLQAPSTAQQHPSSSANAALIQMPIPPSRTDDSSVDPTDERYSWRMCGHQDYVQLEVSDAAAGTPGPSLPRMGEGVEQSSGSGDSDEDDDGELRVDGDAACDANAIERRLPAPAQRITAQNASENSQRRVRQKCSASQPDISVANNWKFAQENSLEGLISAIGSNICPFFIMRGASFGPAGSSSTFNTMPQPQATVEDRFLSVFQNEKSKLKEKIKVTPGGAFLSVRNLEDCLAADEIIIYLHFIDEDWKVNRRIIASTFLFGEESSGAILLPYWRSDTTYGMDPAKKALKDAIGDWNLEKQLLGMTLDKSVDIRDLEDNLTGRSYLLAIRKLLTVPCMVDTLHELFGWEPSDFVLQTSKTWSRYMTSSPERKQKYQVVLSQLHLNRPTFGSKRWYITFYGLEAALQFIKSFPNAEQTQSYSYARKPSRKPSSEELEATENFCHFARLVYHAIKVLSDPHTATLNSCFHVLWRLRAALQESSNIINIENVFDVADMQRKFDKNWNKWYLWLSLAVVLDPRYKISFVESCFKQAFSHDASMYISEVRAKLYELYIQYSCHVNEQSNDTLNNSNNRTAAEEFKELDEYLGGELCPQNDAFDILMWWKDNSSTYPTLGKIARDILAIPASAVSAESAFDESDEGDYLFKTRLHPDTIEALVCAQSWRSSGTSGADGGENGEAV